MKDFLRKNFALLIAGGVVLVLITLMLVQVSCSPAVPGPTETALPSATQTSVPTQTTSPTAEPTQTVPPVTPTLQPSATCPPFEGDIQAALQAAIPQDKWGVIYTGRGDDMVWFLGISTGETSTKTVEGLSGDTWSLDLGRLYYLRTDGTLDSLWIAAGFASDAGSTPASTPEPYYSFNDWGEYPDYKKWGWYSSPEALAKLSVKGHIYFVSFDGRFIDKNSIHWDQCQTAGTSIPPAACGIGPVVDPSGGAEFLAGQTPPEGWVLFGYTLMPNEIMLWGDPFPSAVDIPETCP